ncbi:uncharacterized protein N0V89_002828 [Didymosphaeria variabile]|uniref:Acyclic terpene utilisation N-terminal domain-containing protein n=1 Tax=Didymosphaeria variabile TaxID=1932322 RepID=A0A9W8XUX0_9PLEO|nr:uncharacterized protein N0V89_002828 [Didymosphaeria variabile]KAJ4358248.1 hypothetical protein N0V89_002828 [Didymosphaeria variabile]
MRYQAELSDVGFVTGDCLAQVNVGENAQAHAAGQHPGWEQTCWDSIEQTIDLLAKKTIRVVLKGGAHNPDRLAEKVQQLVSSKGLDLKVAYVVGEKLLEDMKHIRLKGLPPHLDFDNSKLQYASYARSGEGEKPIVSANVYLEAQEIAKGLEEGADIIVVGRVADANPVRLETGT